MAHLPFTDTHVHFHDLRVPDLTYEWLEHGVEADDDLGDYGAIRAERYWADDFIAETRFANVANVVHVQAAIGTEDPVAETRWLQSFTDRIEVPQGIVAYADLTADDLDETLERHLEFEAMRGIRDLRYDEYASDQRWERGYARLGELGLVCCDDPLLEQVPELAALAERNPEVTLCVDHACFPRRRDQDYFEQWRRAIHALARVPSTVIKISGLGQCDHTWTVETLRPWVLTCVEEFGVERSFFGTNWPVDRLFSSYGDLIDAYAELVGDFSEAEQRALFSGTADRVFRLN